MYCRRRRNIERKHDAQPAKLSIIRARVNVNFSPNHQYLAKSNNRKINRRMAPRDRALLTRRA